MTGAYILAARRTAVAPRGGALKGFDIHDLAAPVVTACLHDAGLCGVAVDEIIVGNALGAGGNPARITALAAGLPERVAGISLDSQCCSGLDAISFAEAMIGAGQADIVVAGGVESYSRRPIRLRTPHAGGEPTSYDQARFTPWPDRDPDMAAAASALAETLAIPRARQDAWAVRSHERALAARDALAAEICPLSEAEASHDTFTRHLTPALCRRARSITGPITHANAAVAADAAAFCIVVSERIATASRRPAVRILGSARSGSTPDLPGLAPVAAVRALLERLDLTVRAIARAEIMEAYAVQALACIDGIGIDPDRVNVRGGALARGHPIAASGAILAVRLFHDLCETSLRGLAAIAGAGGLGSAVALQGTH